MQPNTAASNIALRKELIFSFGSNCMVSLEAAVCDAVELYHVTLTGISVILSTPFMSMRVRSLHSAIQFDSATNYKMIIQLNQRLKSSN